MTSARGLNGLFGLDDSDERESSGPGAPKKPSLGKIRYTHDAIIDEILLDPSISQNELSAKFGYGIAWMSIVINSDSFKERLAERKGELVDPIIKASIEEKAAAASNRALDRLIDRLDGPNPGAIKTQDLVAIAKLTVAPKNLAPPAPTQNLYVVQLPAPAPDSQSWLQNRSIVPSRANPPGSIPMVEIVTGG
jgi:hypothetical protein